MKLPIMIAEKLLLLQKGEKIAYSKLKHSVIDLMIENGILKKMVHGRSKTLLYLENSDNLNDYLQNHFGINNLDIYTKIYRSDNLSRADSIEISSNSKLKNIRTFKGFLVNCFEPVDCMLNNHTITIQPQEGAFVFIYDYENFIPSPSITIVGIENPENFRQIAKQKNLFSNIHALFVSRYPQNKDLIRWLQTIQNNYLHFGDFDYAGLNIYHNEYKKHLKNKASFFLPSNIEQLLSQKGNRANYNNQKIQFDRQDVKEENVLILLKLIEQYKKGLEQEIFAK